MLELLNALTAKFAGRSREIELLLSLLGEPYDPTPPGIFVYGPAATGKTSVIQDMLEAYDKSGDKHAYINCIECFSPRLIFERVLNAWANHRPCKSNKYANYVRCDNLVDFVNNTSHLLHNRVETSYLVLDQAERLRDKGPMLLTAFLRLSELTGCQVSVILISNVVWDKFRPRHGGAPDPILVHFSNYTKEQILDILSADCPDDEPQSFFLTFVDAVYEIFHRNCVDLNEIRHLVAMLYPKFVQPVFEKQATRNEIARLFKLCQPYFSSATNKLYLREISTSEWLKNSTVASVKISADDITSSIHNMTDTSMGLELPYYTKFILIASYLASYNPARLDMQYFARNTDKPRKRRRKVAAATLNGAANKQTQQLLGPKSFAIERMLAIFYSIISESLDSSVDVQIQIASLVNLRLLTKVSTGDRLDNIKCKCNVNIEFIRTVSRSVRFEVDRFLYDFS